MKTKTLISILIAGVLFFGCGGLEFGGLGETKKEITLESVNKFIKGYLPQKQKASFGKMEITGVTALPGDAPNSIDFMVYFNIVTFQIPEGLDGSVTYSSSLRFTPASYSLYPKDLNRTNLSFANQSMVEYVSRKAAQGIPVITKNFLLGQPIYKIPRSLKVKKLSKFETTADGKLILYFK
jgi:hypothetical protein